MAAKSASKTNTEKSSFLQNRLLQKKVSVEEGEEEKPTLEAASSELTNLTEVCAVAKISKKEVNAELQKSSDIATTRDSKEIEAEADDLTVAPNTEKDDSQTVQLGTIEVEEDEIDKETERLLLEGGDEDEVPLTLEEAIEQQEEKERLKELEERKLIEEELEDMREEEAVLAGGFGEYEEGKDGETATDELLDSVSDETTNKANDDLVSQENTESNDCISNLEQSLLAFDREQEEKAAKSNQGLLEGAEGPSTTSEIVPTVLQVNEVVENSRIPLPSVEEIKSRKAAGTVGDSESSGGGGRADDKSSSESTGQDEQANEGSDGQGGNQTNGAGDGSGDGDGNDNNHNNFTSNLEDKEEEQEEEEEENISDNIKALQSIALTIKKVEPSSMKANDPLVNSSITVQPNANHSEENFPSVSISSSDADRDLSFNFLESPQLSSSVSISCQNNNGASDSLSFNDCDPATTDVLTSLRTGTKRKSLDEDQEADHSEERPVKQMRSDTEPYVKKEIDDQSELEENLAKTTSSIESKLGAAISVTFKNNSSLSISGVKDYTETTDSESQQKPSQQSTIEMSNATSKFDDSQDERLREAVNIMKSFGGIAIKRVSQESDESNSRLSRRSSNDSTRSEESHEKSSLGMLKDISISSVSAKCKDEDLNLSKLSKDVSVSSFSGMSNNEEEEENLKLNNEVSISTVSVKNVGNKDKEEDSVSKLSKDISISSVSVKSLNEDEDNNLNKLTKDISISSVSVKSAASREQSSSPSDPSSRLSSSLSALGSSISINKTNLPSGISVSSVSSSVSVIKNLDSDRSNNGATANEQPNLPSSSDEDSTSTSRLLETSMKASKEIPSLLQISKEVDVKPILNEKGNIVNNGNSKERSKDGSSLPSGVDTSKLNPSISIIAVSSVSNSEKGKSTYTTTAPSRPASGTSARSNSTSPASSSSTSPAVGNISVKGSSLLHGDPPPPPPLSQANQSPSLSSSSSRSHFSSPTIPNLAATIRGAAGMRGISPGLLGPPGNRLNCPPLRQGGQQIPPEAGPLSQQLHQHAHKLAEMMRASLEEVLAGLVVAGTPEARVAALQLELERSSWRHQQELAEVRHNADIMLGEMRASMEADKHRAVEEVSMYFLSFTHI